MSGSARAGLRFHDLGPIAVDLDTRPVAVRGPKISPVLAMLLVHANTRVSTDALIEAIWGEDPADNASATLDSHLWRLRRLLEPDRQRGRPFTTIVHDNAGYRLSVTAEQVDSLHVDQLLDDARDLLVTDQPARALSRCEEGLSMWRGAPWSPHSDEQWAVASVNRLVEVHAQLRETHIRALLDLGDSDRALAVVGPLVEAEPLRERLWEMAMLAAYRSGRANQALDTYAHARRTLIEETGIEPGTSLQDLQTKILERDPSLDGRPRTAWATRPAVQPAELHLPHRRTDLIGRDQALSELVKAVTTTALVTITGTAGAGKTRLSIEAARAAAPTFPDGVWFIDLTVAHDSEQLQDLVTSALGLTTPKVGGVPEALRSFTRQRRMLLVLDNCEHLLDAAASFIDALLEPGSELAVLATSREPLALDIEHLHPLPPLPVPEGADNPRNSAAVQLFADRLSVTAPHLNLSDDDLTLVSEISRAVDGLPLALELAAGQARSFTLAEIAERVRRDPARLTQVGRATSPHHATLHGAIELSAETLTPDELTVHRAVAVIPGPFTANLAAHVAALSQETTDQALAGLVHRSMLNALGPQRAGGASRFAQLATIRAHGLGHSEGRDENEHRRDMWVGHLVADLQKLDRVVDLAWQHAIDDDLAAVRATLQHTLVEHPHPLGPATAANLTLYWNYSAMVIEWEHWTALASQLSEASAVDRLLCSGSRANAAAHAGRHDLLQVWLDDLDTSTVPLTPPHQTRLAELLLLTCLTTWITGGHAVSERAAARIDQLEDETADNYLDVLSSAAKLLVRSRSEAAADVLDTVEASYRRAEAGHHAFARWLIAIAATAAALTTRRATPGLVWSDRIMGFFADLEVQPNVPSLEIRGALHLVAGHPTEAISTLAAARAAARRIGLPWPSLPMTPVIFAQANSALSDTDAETAYRRGLLGTEQPDEPRRARLQAVAS